YGLLPGSGGTSPPALNEGQAAAVAAIQGSLGGFQAWLLDGVTGSGKTEVYLAAIDAVLAHGQQVLVLVPEIGLTPQLLRRFARRFEAPMAVLHSGLSDGERLGAWLAAARGEARLVIGTRSAVFAPLAEPGLIVVDEEHDLSFKQQDGVRYHGRDLAVVRAQRLGVPIVLGSATPSLESLANVERDRYRRLHLPQRAGGASMPTYRVMDIRGKPLKDGLSQPLIERMRTHLAGDGQVLLFLNRRGFAPTLLCHECGWLAECPRCDARLTLHQRRMRLICHHCDYQRGVDEFCPDCDSADLRPVGQGTERLEQALDLHFPGVGRVRIDRDSTRRRGALEQQLAAAAKPENRILLGTQMLAKGHHLPAVTLAAVVDADQGLFGSDFRAPERLAQLLVQVAGRAGRADRPGEVAIQTHHPEHPLLQTLLSSDYARFAQEALAERRAIRLPPYTAMALLRAEAVDPEPPTQFLESARRSAERQAVPGVELLGPVPAPMERRAGRYRAQLLLQAEQRAHLQQLLSRWVIGLAELPSARRVRWSLDVDPMEML
ncbi:primosomal protein N', partial [Ectothiorhodospiraceae bacterium WFHF3C12]|nr:primosomal protein N' [Ectothiorhodospiraceae bacterium WFHF3C12]